MAPPNSFNNEIGHPLTVLRADESTRYLVSELSARGPGHIAALCQIAPPTLGVVLCVGNAHAGEFGDQQQIARAKSELPAALPPGGVALLNADDPLVAAMAGRTAARVVTFGRSPDADVRAQDVSLDRLSRPRFRLVTAHGSAEAALLLHGEHNVTNALAAAALAAELGMEVDAIAAGLADAGVASEPAALAYGLAFVPLAAERFDLVIPAGQAAAREVQALMKVLSSRWLLDQLASLPGYDPAPCGQRVATVPGTPQDG